MTNFFIGVETGLCQVSILQNLLPVFQITLFVTHDIPSSLIYILKSITFHIILALHSTFRPVVSKLGYLSPNFDSFLVS